MSPLDPQELRAVIDELANALQGAISLAALLRREAQTMSIDAVTLEDSLTRAVSAVKRLQLPSGSDEL